MPKEKAGILVDEQFGAAILRDAAAHGFTTACPAEKSGQEEFDFEYGEDFAKHIEAFQPTFCKVLVRYNPEGRSGSEQAPGRPFETAVRLSAWQEPEPVHVRTAGAAREGTTRPAQRRQEGLRPATSPRADGAGHRATPGRAVEPDVWKIEGLDRREDCEKIVDAAHRGGRDHVGCIILGRGEDDQKVREWLTTASTVPGFIGFAVGRTSFWDPLVAWRAKKITREEAVNEIAAPLSEFVDIFEEKAHAA